MFVIGSSRGCGLPVMKGGGGVFGCFVLVIEVDLYRETVVYRPSSIGLLDPRSENELGNGSTLYVKYPSCKL